MYYNYHQDGSSGLPRNQIKNLTISNISSLDLSAQMSTSMPFSLIDEETGTLVQEMPVILKTGQSVHLDINFDTRFKEDLHSEIVRGQLAITYAEHQENVFLNISYFWKLDLKKQTFQIYFLLKDYVNLISEIYFPNVHLETTNVNFGCILNNTEVHRHVKMTNTGPLIVHYKWKFVLEKDNIVLNSERLVELKETQNQSLQLADINESDEDELIGAQKSELFTENPESEGGEKVPFPVEKKEQLQDVTSQMIKSKSKNKLEELMLNKSLDIELPSIEEIFDISPLYGSLHPGESQDLTITYYGHKEIKAYVRAVCEVKNGPSYEMFIQGEASVLSYELSTKFIDFGCIVNYLLSIILFVNVNQIINSSFCFFELTNV